MDRLESSSCASAMGDSASSVQPRWAKHAAGVLLRNLFIPSARWHDRSEQESQTSRFRFGRRPDSERISHFLVFQCVDSSAKQSELAPGRSFQAMNSEFLPARG